QNPTKCRHGIASQCIYPRLLDGRTGSNATCVSMFQNSESGCFKLIDYSHCGIDIDQVVVRKFLAIELIKHRVQITEEYPALMWIFGVALDLSLLFGLLVYFNRDFLVEVIEESCVVM